VQRDDRWFYHPIKVVERASVSSALDDESISMDGEDTPEVIAGRVGNWLPRKFVTILA